MTQLQRDPFARMTLMREKVDDPKPCQWCGSRPGRFRYFRESDGGKRPMFYRLSSAFCSVGCYRSYHD